MEQAIAIDFDGTIVENKFPYIGKIQPYAEYAIQWLNSEFRVFLWTCRYGESLEDAKVFCKNNGIELQEPQEWQGDKKVASLYIDDRSCPGFLGWLPTMYIISESYSIELPSDFPYQEMDNQLKSMGIDEPRTFLKIMKEIYERDTTDLYRKKAIKSSGIILLSERNSSIKEN